MGKKFRLAAAKIKPLVDGLGSCIASDRITVDGKRIGFMYREPPDNSTDSGWRFFAGDEDQEYAENPANFTIYNVNTIANYDPKIIPYLDAQPRTAFGWNEQRKCYVDEGFPGSTS